MDEQRKLSLVAEIVEAWNAGNHDLLLATLADDALLRSLRSQLEGRSYRGPDGLRQALVEWEEEWEYVRFERREETAKGDFVLGGRPCAVKGEGERDRARRPHGAAATSSAGTRSSGSSPTGSGQKPSAKPASERSAA